MNMTRLVAVVRPAFAIAFGIYLVACVAGGDPSDDTDDESVTQPVVQLGFDGGGGGCGSSRHFCPNLGGCVTNNSPNHCGVACTPCGGLAHGKATCVAKGDAHSCSGKCNSGFKLCHSDCIPNKQRCN